MPDPEYLREDRASLDRMPACGCRIGTDTLHGAPRRPSPKNDPDNTDDVVFHLHHNRRGNQITTYK